MSNRTTPYYEPNKEQNTDNKLIQEYKKTGESKYMGELYGRYKGKIFGKCISMLCNEEEARDAVQDIFIKVLAKIGTFSEESSFSTRLYSITYNHCIDILRRRGKNRIEELTESYNNEQEEETPNAILLEHKISILNTILGDLSSNDQNILYMKYKDDKSMEEIRVILQHQERKDIGESVVKMRLKRAKDRAQEKLKTIGGFGL